MAARTPKQLMGDSKKRKAQNMGKIPPAVGLVGGDKLANLDSLRSWVPRSKAKAITAKAKKIAVGKVKK